MQNVVLAEMESDDKDVDSLPIGLINFDKSRSSNSRAGEDDDDESVSFMDGIWSTFLFAFIGVVVFAVALIFLIRCFSSSQGNDSDHHNRKSKKTDRYDDTTMTNVASNYERENRNFQYDEDVQQSQAVQQQNAWSRTYTDQTQPQQQNYEQRNVSEVYTENRPHQEQPQPVPLVGMIPYERNDPYQQQDEMQRSEYTQNYQTNSAVTTNQQSMKKEEPFSYLEKYDPPVIVPVGVPPQKQDKKNEEISTVSQQVDRQTLQDTEYHGDTAEGKFQYLDNYAAIGTGAAVGAAAASSKQKREPPPPNEKPKRAVLRSDTPYKTIEERTKQGDFDSDMEMAATSPKSNYSAVGNYGGTYDDGAFSYFNAPPPTSPTQSTTFASTEPQSPPAVPVKRTPSNTSNLAPSYGQGRFVQVLPRHPASGMGRHGGPQQGARYDEWDE